MFSRYVSEVNRKKKSSVCNGTFLKKSIEFWDTAIFFDKSKFKLFGSDVKKFVAETQHKITTKIH